MADKMEHTQNVVAAPARRLRLDNVNGNLLRLLVAVVAIFAIMSIARPETFLTVQNIQSMAFQTSEIGVLAIAIAVTMLTGGIDLSIVSTANLAGIIAGLVLTAAIPDDPTGGQVALGMTLAIGAALGVGLVAGAFNGLIIGWFDMAPILATLGTMLIYKGIGTAITKGSTVFGVTQSQFIGNGKVLGVPFPLIILLVVAVLVSLYLRRTRVGMRIYMLGTNPTAARYSGINNRAVLMNTYIISGLLAAIAGIIILGRTNAANVDFGAPYVLLSILVAVLGDVDPYGGSGTILGVMLALIGVQFLSTGVNMLLFRSSGANFFKEFSWGALLLIVLVVNYFSHQRQMRPAASSAEPAEPGTQSPA